MELQLATIGDIVEELRRRQLKFVLIGTEATNSRRMPLSFVAGQGEDREEMLYLISLGHAAIQDGDEEEA